MNSQQDLQNKAKLANKRKLVSSDVPVILEKIFQKIDVDKNNRFNRQQFIRAIKILVQFIGAENPPLDDVQDLFNLLDINGDQTIDRVQFKSLLTTFFNVLTQKQIDVRISVQSDIIL